MASSHPANYWQKGAHGGKTSQITRRADKAWAVTQIDIIYKIRLMRVAVGGARALLKVSWKMTLEGTLAAQASQNES